MKFYVDENLPQALSRTLSSLVGNGHRFFNYSQEHLQGALDIPLFDHLQSVGYNAIITKDVNQLEDHQEHAALRAAGLHWVGLDLPSLEGLTEIRAVTGTLLGGIPYVLRHWADEPSSYVFKVHPRGWQPPHVSTL